MRIVTWNSRKAVGARLADLASTEFDVAALQECEANPGAGRFDQIATTLGIPGRHVAIISSYKLDPVAAPSVSDVPVDACVAAVVNSPEPFVFVSLCSHPSGPFKAASYSAYNRFVFDHFIALNHRLPVVIAGDFNANASFAGRHRGAAHRNNMILLYDNGFVSAYHRFFAEEPGLETRNTYFPSFRPPRDRPHHIDYVFVPAGWSISDVSIGPLWGSDHKPMIVECFSS
jgi:endonuclease/exonuclease/phosphatase family metal-dependent hydrolase